MLNVIIKMCFLLTQIHKLIDFNFCIVVYYQDCIIITKYLYFSKSNSEKKNSNSEANLKENTQNNSESKSVGDTKKASTTPKFYKRAITNKFRKIQNEVPHQDLIFVGLCIFWGIVLYNILPPY